MSEGRESRMLPGVSVILQAQVVRPHDINHGQLLWWWFWTSGHKEGVVELHHVQADADGDVLLGKQAKAAA